MSTGSVQVPYTIQPYTDPSTGPETALSQSQQTYPYQEWMIENVYKRNPLVVQMPIAGTPASPYAATSAFLTLASEQCVWVIRAYAERIGDFPEFIDPNSLPQWPYPNPVPTGYAPPTLVYLGYKIKPCADVKTAAGQWMFAATMEIRIGLSRPPVMGEPLAMGENKWNNTGPVASTATLTSASWAQ